MRNEYSAIPTTGQKDRGLWGREWAKNATRYTLLETHTAPQHWCKKPYFVDMKFGFLQSYEIEHSDSGVYYPCDLPVV